MRGGPWRIVFSAIVIAIGGALAAGCATSPAEEAHLGVRSRVGIVNLVRPQMSHYNIGPTSLGNFGKRYMAGDMPGYILETLRRELRSRHDYNLLLAEPTPELLAAGRRVLHPYQEALVDTAVAGVQRLAREHELEHILLITEVCTSSPVQAKGEKCGYGVYTEQTASGGRRAFAYFDVVVLRVSPKGTLLRPITTVLPAMTVTELRDELHPADVERATVEELLKIEPHVQKLARQRIADAAGLVK